MSVLSPSTAFPLYSIGVIVAATVIVAIVVAACVVKAKRATNKITPTANLTVSTVYSQVQYEQTSSNDGHPMGLDDGCAEYETPSTDVMRGSTQVTSSS